MNKDIEKKNILFCKIFMELLTELVELYPEDKKFKLAQVTANGMILVDKSSFVNTILDTLEPYYNQILIKDEHFFMNLDTQYDGEYSFINDEINKIRSIWVSPYTSDDTKKCIWKYFTSFVKIGQMIRKP